MGEVSIAKGILSTPSTRNPQGPCLKGQTLTNSLTGYTVEKADMLNKSNTLSCLGPSRFNWPNFDQSHPLKSLIGHKILDVKANLRNGRQEPSMALSGPAIGQSLANHNVRAQNQGRTTEPVFMPHPSGKCSNNRTAQNVSIFKLESQTFVRRC